MTLRTRRLARTAAVVIVGALALSACGTTGPTATSASDGDLSMWGLSNAPMQEIMADSVTAWNEANPEGTIGIDFFANDAYKTKVRTAIGAGAGPTFIYGWGGGILES